MELPFNELEFRRFIQAHIKINHVLAWAFLGLAAVIGFARWGLDALGEPFSYVNLAFAAATFVVALLIPRLGYKLAVHVVGDWYRPEFGSNFREYAHNEKLLNAKRLVEDHT